MKYTTLKLTSLLVLILLANSSLSNSKSEESESTKTLRKKVGQMLVLGFPEAKLARDTPIVEEVRAGLLGGVILFNNNFTGTSPEEISKNILQQTTILQEESRIPLFIGIDQEGGRIARLSKKNGFKDTPTARELGTINDLHLTYQTGISLGKLLHSLQFNLNFAPVVDLNINPNNRIINRLERSYSSNSHVVSTHAIEIIKAQNSLNIVNIIKHFPGHGNSNGDTHKGMVNVSKTWEESELNPYKDIIAQTKLNFAIMTAHTYNKNIDRQYPASMSKLTIQGVLRDKIGYNGVIFTDDMEMAAIRKYYSREKAVVFAINAGVDILLFSNNRPTSTRYFATEINKIILKNVAAGVIPVQRINESYRRIMKLKRNISLVNNE